MVRRVSDGSTGSSRRGSGRPATNGTAARPAASKGKGLAQNRRPPRVATPEDDEDELPDEEEEDEDEEGSFAEEGGQKKKNGKGLAADDLTRLVKNFVRYALACECTRTPLRRDEISRKVLEGKYSRLFNQVFEKTQERLEAVFRMRLVELPAKEKHQTIEQQRRTAQVKSAAPTKTWVLTSTLSEDIRGLPDLVDINDQNDAIYQGLICVIVSLIYLSSGMLPEESLTRYLKHLAIHESTPLMSTEKLLGMMTKQGYVDKVKDMVTGEPRFDYYLGPRGKVEVGKEGAMDMVKDVFGEEMTRDLEKRVLTSLDERKPAVAQDDAEAEAPSRKRAREDDEDRPRGARRQREDPPQAESSRAAGSRRRRSEQEEEEEEEEEEEAPRGRSGSKGKAPARGNSRGRGNGRGGRSS